MKRAYAMARSFESLPLAGKQVLITRPRAQAADMARLVEALGGTTCTLPLIEIRPLDDWSAVDQVIGRLGSYAWMVFTSANGVDAFLGRMRTLGRDLSALAPARLAAIGPGTASALRRHHLEPDLVPAEYRSEALVESLRPRLAGKRVLLVRADRGREVLRDELARVGEVEQVAAYIQADVPTPDRESLAALRDGRIDYVALTSSNIARAFAAVLDDPCRAQLASARTRIVTISPVTTSTARAFGVPVSAEATDYTVAGVMDAIVRLARADRPSTQVAESVPAEIGENAGCQDDDDIDGSADSDAKGDLEDQVGDE
jgi:uroporphyrinogen III methyltransferase/synthase